MPPHKNSFLPEAPRPSLLRVKTNFETNFAMEQYLCLRRT
jgi:hypothetical protein